MQNVVDVQQREAQRQAGRQVAVHPQQLAHGARLQAQLWHAGFNFGARSRACRRSPSSRV
jgi:hypothetical protein